MKELGHIQLDEIRAAQERVAGAAIRSPLLPLHVSAAPARIFLKLENLQPIGSFKLRGAGNALLLADRKQLDRGVWTASAGKYGAGGRLVCATDGTEVERRRARPRARHQAGCHQASGG